MIVGWESVDPAQRVIAASTQIVNASIHADYADYARGIATVRYRFEADLVSDDTRPAMWLTAGDTYGQAIRRMAVASSIDLADDVTHHTIAEAVADELEVDVDDALVQRIAAAIMDTGVISGT